MKKKVENLIDIDFVKTLLKERPEDMHKGDCGKVLIVAGTKGMAGAAGLCAKAALRAGCGLAQVAVTEEILPIVQTITPEATCLIRDGLKDLDFSTYDAIAFGPGIGTGQDEKNLLLRILSNYEGPLVVDADGLNIIAKYGLEDEVRNRKCQLIITPHPGEAKRLAGNIEDREEMAKALQEKFQCVALLKGNLTLVALDAERVKINGTGNPGMATAGSGDVLTGIIASFLAQGMSVEDAVQAGPFIHGMSGDIMASDLGQYGLLASDMTFGVALAIKNVAEEGKKH